MANASNKKDGKRGSKDSEKSRSSIEHEYLFEEIPKARPESQPVPRDHKLFEDSKRHPVRGSFTIDAREAEVQAHDLKPDETGTGEHVELGRYDLYKEAMYTCVHMLGAPSPQRFPATQEEMCLYVHEVFGESQKEQDAVFNHVRGEPFPLTIVNAKVKRAVGLHGVKSHGFIDPYCIVTIETEDSSVVFQLNKKEWQEFSVNTPTPKTKDLSKMRSKHLRPAAENRSSQVYEKVPDFVKTSVLRHNDNPRWDQRFQCLALRPSVDKLTVEVWDHSIDDKYVAKAIRNYSETSGATDLDTTLKSAHANAERKKGDVFIGKIAVRVAEIPCDGSDRWYTLSLPNGANDDVRNHGKLRVQIWLVQAYRHGRHYVEVAEPKEILAHFWDWVLKEERENAKNPEKWDGSISSPATCFLFQYALQNGISEDTHAIIRWNAYAKLDLDLHAMQGRLQDLNVAIEKQAAKEVEEEPQPPKPPDTAEAPAAPPPPQPPPKPIRDSQADIEANIMSIVLDKILPIIRNHLNENVVTVHEALRSYHECEELLLKFNKVELIEKIQKLVYWAVRMSILEWYQWLYKNTVPTHGDIKKSEYVGAIAKVIQEVNKLLGAAVTKWGPEFFLIASLEYFPHVYDELQKMIIHDVEATCWIFFQLYGDYKKLRKILLMNEEKDKNLCKEFFELYVQTQTFTTAWNEKLPNGTKGFCCLDQYHRWFRPTLILWLGFALIRGSMMISKAITIDNVVQDNPHAMTSSSALDTATVFHQLVKFWEALNWPDVAEAYVLINFLTEVMCSYTILYAELKRAKLDKEGYYDPRGRFTISERLCTALNNIEHVKDQAQQIPKEIEHAKLVERLEAECGTSELILAYEVRIKDRLEKTAEIVNKHLGEIVDSVGLLIQKEIQGFIDESLNSILELGSEQLEEAILPVTMYLEDNIVTLDKALLPYNFHKMLVLLWNLVCHGIQVRATKFRVDNFDTQYIFFRKIIKTIPLLETYFKGGDVGLSKEEMDTEQYRTMQKMLSYFTMETEELMRIYYHTRAQYYLNYTGETNFGSVKVRVGYWAEKLGVEVLSAADLTPHDEPLPFLKYFKKMKATSDPMVELELKPTKAFPNEKKLTSKVMWNELDPTFEESFHWKLSVDDCLQPAAVLVITVKDYDLLTKNAFLGETMIPLHAIPGISKSPISQPMNLTLHEVDPKEPILTVLKSREWDDKAKAFVDDQLSRFVEPVISRKIKS